MSFDIVQEITKRYVVGVDIDKSGSDIVNELNRERSQDTIDIKFSGKKIQANKDKFISDYVCASYYFSSVHGDKVKDTLKYMYKTNGVYTYSLDKPFEYIYLDYNEFLTEVTNTSISNDREFLRQSIKLKRLAKRSTGDFNNSKDLYSIFDSPYGGLIEGSCYLFTEIEGYTKPIVRDLIIDGQEAIIIDYLEGKVYVHNQYPDVIRNLYMYTDVAPLVIFQSDTFTPTNKEETLGIFNQRSVDGLIDVFKLNDKEYIITLSYDAFIVSSDPYFIEVDGITLLNPRVVPKKTPIYVKQSFSYKSESFLLDYYSLYNSREKLKDIYELSGTHIEVDSSIDTGDLASGLFVYEQDAPFILSSRPNYIPLFKKQTIIREGDNV